MIYIILIPALIAIIYFIMTYNRFIFLDNISRNAKVQVDINIKLRNDLIPSLISIVKSYSEYEKTALKEIADLRASDKSLRVFFVNAENYPKLKADKSFLKFQEEITRLESNIAFKRNFYNDVIFKYNTFLLSFPQNIIGRILGYKVRESFSNDSKYEGVNF